VPANLSEVIAIEAGRYHSLALKADGTVVAWGFNWGTVPANLSGAIAIAAGGSHNLALVGGNFAPTALIAQVCGGGVLIRWPLSSKGYVLESTPTLTSPVWETVTNAIGISDADCVLTNSWSDPWRFFRLRAR
jgi:hypothetical protein